MARRIVSSRPSSGELSPPELSIKTSHQLHRPRNFRPESEATVGEVAAPTLVLIVLVGLVGWLGWAIVKTIREKLDGYDASAQDKTVEERGDILQRFLTSGIKMGLLFRALIYGRRNAREDADEERLSEHDGLLCKASKTFPGNINRAGERVEAVESSGWTTLVHREDCEGQCGLQSRRRSAE